MSVVWTFPPEFTVASFDVTPHNQAGEGRKGGSDGEVMYLFYYFIYYVTPHNQMARRARGGPWRGHLQNLQRNACTSHTHACARERRMRACARAKERERYMHACLRIQKACMHFDFALQLCMCPPRLYMLSIYVCACLSMKHACTSNVPSRSLSLASSLAFSAYSAHTCMHVKQVRRRAAGTLHTQNTHNIYIYIYIHTYIYWEYVDAAGDKGVLRVVSSET